MCTYLAVKAVGVVFFLFSQNWTHYYLFFLSGTGYSVIQCYPLASLIYQGVLFRFSKFLFLLLEQILYLFSPLCIGRIHLSFYSAFLYSKQILYSHCILDVTVTYLLKLLCIPLNFKISELNIFSQIELIFQFTFFCN